LYIYHLHREYYPNTRVWTLLTAHHRGTTGQPKGACITHANVRSTVHYQGAKLGFHAGSRVFDFAPYSFDVAWSNFLHTLCAGGCLCIAREEDMLNDTSAAIAAFKATLINVTPTVLRTISPTEVTTLETVLLSGEMPYRENITKWAGRVRLLNTYGPTECTFKAAFSVLSHPTSTASKEDVYDDERPDIGRGVGFGTWIVDPNDDNKLVDSIGSTGELYLEGPQVGQGYLSDPEKTRSVFIEDPLWLLAGSQSFPGRRGRVYRTGDLVKYKPDGRLVFVGRNDESSQVKIRGQRVEIGDVEHHVRACLNDSLPIIVDVIRPHASDSSTLTVFVVVRAGDDLPSVKTLLDGLADKLLLVLPGFMLPSLYFPIDEIPVAATGKVDRRKLRELGSALTWNELVRLQSTILSVKEYVEPAGDIERQLCEIWANVLNLDPAQVSTTDDFLRLGGDSIAAMQVVASSRKKNLSLTVADIFKNPVLGDLARCVRHRSPLREMGLHNKDTAISSFSLLGIIASHESICEEAAKLCQVKIQDIEDIYPCTPLQEGMLAMSVKNDIDSPENYISRTAYELNADIDIKKMQRALSNTASCIPILRTRVINLPNHGLVQVVVKLTDSMLPQEYTHFAQFFDQGYEMGLGTPLYRVGIVLSDAAGPNVLALELHHAIFDGWCTMLILDTIQEAYHLLDSDTFAAPLAPFQPFVEHVLATINDKTASFWKSQLTGSEAIVFPASNYHPEKKLDIHHQVQDLAWPQTGVTPSSIIRSALTVLLASYTNSDDINYGETLSGRQASIPGIERMAGPTIATVPFRVKFDWGQTVKSLQQKIQDQAAEMAEYEQFGLQRIRRIDEEASKFQLELVIQPSQKGESQKPGGFFHEAKTIVIDDSSTLKFVAKDGIDDSIGIYNSYAMMVICQLTDSGLTLKINFDTGAIKQKQVQRFANQFEHLLRQLSSPQNADTKLRDLSVVSNTDINEIFQWNRRPIQEPIDLVTDRIDCMATITPEATSISSWDRELTYRQLRNLTTNLAWKLRGQGICPGHIVVLSFEKASYMMVSMLSVLKLGAIALPMSAFVSKERAQEIVKTLQPYMVITSQTDTASTFDGLVPTFRIYDLIQASDDEIMHDVKPHNVQLSDPALIIFTSGSTGTPKSILWSHKTLAGNIRAATQGFGITAHTKVFQFAGYEFDVSTVEGLSTLSAGGLLYTPSEYDRTNRLAAAIQDSQANWICLTPRVSETLDPRELLSLRTIVFAGEELKRETAFRWLRTLNSVYNWYGPAEASVATSYVVQKETWVSGIIGSTTPYASSWLVDPRNYKSLAPIGAVAELCIEGPIVSRYRGLNGTELNQKHFFSPTWFKKDRLRSKQGPELLYKTGDLVKYGTNGEIIFLGRIHESQRKLRGQRVDLSEIESHVHAFLSGKVDVMVVAEIFSPLNSNSDVLALFISITGTLAADSVDKSTFEQYIKQGLPVDDLEASLLKVLPPYMIPKLYIPILGVPISNTGKTDRRRLREIGSSFSFEQLAEMQPSRREIRKPSTDTEKLLQQLWAEIIGIDAESIFASDNFLRLGGDSIAAMRLVASARAKGLILTVTDIFESPELESLAQRVRREEDVTPEEEIAPFSLLDPSLSEAEYRAYAASTCSIAESRIVDMYPCTPLQEGLLVLGEKAQGQYVSRSVLQLQDDIDASKLQKAWLNTVNRLPILRTRIVDGLLGQQGLMQVVLNSLPLRAGSDVSTYLNADEQEHMGLGTDLCRAAIINRSFVLTIHHCIYDGMVLKMILNELECQYLEGEPPDVVPFQNFIHRLIQVNPEEATAFWKQQLALSGELRCYPETPSPGYKPQANAELEHTVRLDWPRGEITPSTIVRSSWALLTSQYVASSNIVFGVTVSGRQIDMKGVENCAGPTISTIPIPVSIDWGDTVDGFLAQMQRQGIEMTPYEQYGVQNIRHIAEGLESADSLFRTLLVVQPVAHGGSLNEDNLLFKARSYSSSLQTQGTDPFNTYPLMLICELGNSGLQIRFSFDDDVIDKKQIERIAHQFDQIIHQLCMDNVGNIKLDDIETASKLDLDLFWGQNRELSSDVDECVHQWITLTAKKIPDTLAIDAWDGKFSYRELDELSSLLCQKLINLGVRKGSVVALCFEKSKWAPVAQIAVLKAGAVALLQSIHVPDHRVGTVFKKSSVHLAVASESRVEIVSQYVPCFTIDQLLNYSSKSSPIANTELPTTGIRDPAAILVSSGTTGEPKQILWSHRTLAANIRGHQEHIPMDASTRVFQFASYDFDLATLETMSTFSIGACLCIPSESERLDNLTAAIHRLKSTHLHLTPSTADLLQPESIPTVSTVILAGEKLVSSSVDRWKDYCRVLGWYGPAECASAAFSAPDAKTWYSGVISYIGSKQPSLCWLVDPRNTERLAPYGAIGEIALEGPASSNGYIGNSTLTQSRFRQNPKFLQQFPEAKERSIIYYTGDLARYDNNGNLVILGRKDTQLKVHGQLVVPDEVEHHIKSFLSNGHGIQVIVDAIKANKDKKPTLVAFLQHNIEHEVAQMTSGLHKQLAKVLPRYAIPSYYIPISKFPKTGTDKVDRARLREMGDTFDLIRQSTIVCLKRREPTTTTEKTLQRLWAAAIGIPPDEISASDSFLQTGDSIRAMRLVGLTRQQGLLLTVADVFENPVLEDMAKVLRVCKEDATSQQEIAPYSLVGQEEDFECARKQAASICGVGIDDIEDIIPCTQMQESLLSLTVGKRGNYTGRNIFQLASSINIEHFKGAWERVVTAIPILRTRIIDLSHRGLVQVVIKSQDCWTVMKSIDDFIDQETQSEMGLGRALMRCGLFPTSPEEDVHITSQPYYFALTMHHSIYDGITTNLIFDTLKDFYNDVEQPLLPLPFQPFLKYIDDQDKDAESKFWNTQFAALDAPQFPPLPSSVYQPRTDTVIVHCIKDISWRRDNYTPTTVLYAAFALLCSYHSNSSDVVFGTVVSGRKVPVAGIERLAGPTIATVPLRVKIDEDDNVWRLLNSVQKQTTEMIPYEQTGLSIIRQMSDEAEQACQFQTFVVIQPEENDLQSRTGLFSSQVHHVWSKGKSHSKYGDHGFNPCALTIACTIRDAGLDIEFSFDSIVLDEPAVRHMSHHFEHILRTLCSQANDEVPLQNINMTMNQDLEHIWEWNAQLPEAFGMPMHELISSVAEKQPDATVISAWDGELTYQNFERLTTNIAQHLTSMGVKRNMIIPLVFEKSIFAPIAFFSVIKAGGAGLFLDPILPESRLISIIDQVESALIICSASNVALSKKVRGSSASVFSLDWDVAHAFIENDFDSTSTKESLPKVDPSDLLYAIFTSGSTGTPKGCQMQHRNFSSAVALQKQVLGLNTTSRMYDFSSYSFDAAHWGMFHVLAAGGTLCIPSEDERNNELSESMRRFKTTDVFLTPSVARSIDPTNVPTLRNIHLGGEEATRDDFARWVPHANTFNSYGPAECSAGTLYGKMCSDDLSKISIGKGVGVSTWIVDLRSPKRLSPIGAVGELYLEGPLVGLGYLGDEAKTATSFIQNPPWLLAGSPSGVIPGRYGRLYKTGDLVKYDATSGELLFIGRKDTQIKLRGQRIELSEIEYHIRQCMRHLETVPLTAEVIIPNMTKKKTLVLFLQVPEKKHQEILKLIRNLESQLRQRVPSYMIPSAYVPLELIPLTATGKTDRRRLRDLGADLKLHYFNQEGVEGTEPPSTAEEIRLQEFWATILSVPSKNIRKKSSFFQLGGDSISAMRLAALARSQGLLSLTVQNILSTPRLSDMAGFILSSNSASTAVDQTLTISPFSLLTNPSDKDKIIRMISRQCNMEVAQIEDIFPCTGVQKSLLSMTAKAANSYIARLILQLRENVDIDRLQRAWKHVSETTAPILRVRIVDVPEVGLLQVQIKEPVQWDSSDEDAMTYINHDQTESMGLSTALTRLAVLRDSKNPGQQCLLLTQHHAIYDGYSIDLLLQEVFKAYIGVSDPSPTAPFQSFLQYVMSIDTVETREFWRKQFLGSEAVPFPALPHQDYRPKADNTVCRDFKTIEWPKNNATASTSETSFICLPQFNSSNISCL
jgi:amino acid adenylation domain-containing protein